MKVLSHPARLFLSDAWRCAALLLAALLLVLSTAFTAYAASGSLSVGYEISYGGWRTHSFTVDGRYRAYCVNPQLPTPSNGTYEEVPFLDNLIAGPNETIVMSPEYAASLIYCSWGCPGFDESMWPETWFDGSAWTDDKRMAINHILWTNAYNNTAAPALHGTSAEFKEWYDWHFNDWPGNENSDNSYMRLCYDRFLKLPASYREAFQDSLRMLVIPGGVQNIGYMGDFDPTGSIDLQKISANPSITEGNGLYSLEGAQYGVYEDEACTRLIGTLDADSNGYAKIDGVSIGWKWVKETKAPEGFWPDETVYPVYVSLGETVRVNGSVVEDDPINDPAPILVQKLDGEIWKTPQDPR